MTNGPHAAGGRSFIGELAIAIAAFSRRLVAGIVSRARHSVRAALRAVRRVFIWVADAIYEMTRTLGRIYLRIERALVGFITETVLLVWAFRSLGVLVASEVGLVYLARQWPWLWLVAIGWAVLLAMGVRDALRRGDSDSVVEEEASLARGHRFLNTLVRWGLRLAVMIGGILITARFAGSLETPSAAWIYARVVARSGNSGSGTSSAVDTSPFLIRPALDTGPPAIHGDGRYWSVTLPYGMQEAIRHTLLNFTLCGPAHFANTNPRLVPLPVGVSERPNAVIADFNGDSISDAVLVGTGTGPVVLALVSSGVGIYHGELLPTMRQVDCSGTKRSPIGLRYLPLGWPFTDRSGEYLGSPGVSLWDYDVGSDMFYFASGLWIHVSLAGD